MAGPIKTLGTGPRRCNAPYNSGPTLVNTTTNRARGCALGMASPRRARRHRRAGYHILPGTPRVCAAVPLCEIMLQRTSPPILIVCKASDCASARGASISSLCSSDGTVPASTQSHQTCLSAPLGGKSLRRTRSVCGLPENCRRSVIAPGPLGQRRGRRY